MTLDSTRTAALAMGQDKLWRAAAAVKAERDLVEMRKLITAVCEAAHQLYALNMAAEEETRAEAIRRLEGTNA